MPFKQHYRGTFEIEVQATRKRKVAEQFLTLKKQKLMESQVKATAHQGLQVLMIMAEVYSRMQTKKAEKKVSDTSSKMKAE